MEGVDATLPPVASHTRDLVAQLSVVVPATELSAFSTGNCSTQQESSVSSPRGDTDMMMHQLQAPTPSGSSGGFSVAGKACDAAAAALASHYTTQRCQQSYATGQDQRSFTTSRWERLSTE